MFNVKRKPIIPTRLPEADEVLVPKIEIEPPGQCSVPEDIEKKSMASPPLTPGSEAAGDASTDEPSVESVEEPTVQEPRKYSDKEWKHDGCTHDECNIHEFDKNDACENEACENEACENEACKNDAGENEACENEACENEACKNEACKNEACKHDTSKDESAQSPARDDEANTPMEHHNPDNERVNVARAPRKPKQKKIITHGKFFCAWLLFWALALAACGIAYYFNHSQPLPLGQITNAGFKEETLMLIPRQKWDHSQNALAKQSSYVAQRVVVVQTDTERCNSIPTCTNLLNAMNRQEGPLKYNFFLSSDGCIYEGLGWQEPSPLYPDVRTMVVAFIGDYKSMGPTTMQLRQLKALLDASKELKYLSETFTILGRKQSVQPSKLFAYLAAFEKWDKENSDTDEQYIEVEFDKFPMFL